MEMEPAWDIGGAISNGIERFKENAGLVIGAVIMVGFANLLVNVPSNLAQVASQAMMAEMDPDQQAMVQIFVGLFQMFIGLISFVVQTYLGLGLIQLMLNIVRGNEASFADFKVPGGVFAAGLGAAFLAALGTATGMLFCIVPGVMLGMGLWFQQYVIIDQQIGAVDALKESWRLTDGSKLQLFALALVSGLIMLAGMAACGVGLLVAGPVVALANATVYNAMVEQKGTALQPLV